MQDLEQGSHCHHEYGLDATCLLYANVYGPRQNTHGEAKAGEQHRSSISSALLAWELGVEVAKPLAEGIQTTADWFKARV